MLIMQWYYDCAKTIHYKSALLQQVSMTVFPISKENKREIKSLKQYLFIVGFLHQKKIKMKLQTKFLNEPFLSQAKKVTDAVI